MGFSYKERQHWLDKLNGATVDIAIIGGGVVGCSIAAHLASIGIPCVLLEKEDLGAGASGNSTGLAHAGLRYLAQGRIGYVFHESRERRKLQELAPQWVRPFDFLYPVYDGDPFNLFMVRIGTTIYDAMAWLDARWTGKSSPKAHGVLNADEVSARVPALKVEGLQGAAEYFVDAQLQDARFTLGFAQLAASRGASIVTHARVDQKTPSDDGQGPMTLRCTDRLSGRPFQFQASLVINAAGAWMDSIGHSTAGSRQKRVQPSQGIHLVINRIAERPLIFSATDKGRVFFALPYGRDATLVGTTDTPLVGSPDDAGPTSAEIQSLLQELFRYFPKLKRDDFARNGIRDVYWGLRPLISHKGKASDASRAHVLIMDKREWSVPGVKLTSGRGAGEEVALKAARAFSRAAPRSIHLGRLPGGEFDEYESFMADITDHLEKGGCSRATAIYLAGTYGTRARAVWNLAGSDSALAERVLPDEPWIYAEVVYAGNEEMALTLNDFLWRRSKWSHFRDLPDAVIERLSHLAARAASWDDARRLAEIAAYRSERCLHRWPPRSEL